tara:strand:- start:212 stop:385 length:174 start_codon:yes stop_codon:yes gene_type:complete
MKNKNIIEAMKSIFMHGFDGAEIEQFETRLDCTRKELLEAEDLLRKFIDLCEKKLKD